MAKQDKQATKTAADYFQRKEGINLGKSMPVEMYGIVRANKRH